MSFFESYLPYYTSSVNKKIYSTGWGITGADSGQTEMQQMTSSVMWKNTGAITFVQVTCGDAGQFGIGTLVCLYGEM